MEKPAINSDIREPSQAQSHPEYADDFLRNFEFTLLLHIFTEVV
jgi:hypothetical protein